MNLPVGAIRALAAVELRRRWRALVVLGVIAGLVGAAVVGAIALAQRTATAHERLEEAVHVEDARVILFDRQLTDEVSSLPGVESSWEASLFVAKLDRPGVNYVGVVSGPTPPEDLYSPILIDGRLFDVSAPDEVVVLEQATSLIGLQVGDEIGVRLLLPEEVAMFDTGFGEPDGPVVQLRVTGVIRVPGDLNGSPILASPAFVEHYGEFAAGTTMFIRYEDEVDAREQFLAGARELNDRAEPIPGGEEFDPIEVTDASRNEQLILATTRVLVGGLLVFVAVATITGLVALTQVFGRHHAGGAEQQQVEAALGLTAGERVLCRVLPALVTGAIAALVTFAGTLVAGFLEPSGALRRVEPHPGWAPNIAVALVGAAGVAAVTVGLSAVAARRAGSARARIAGPPGRSVARVRRVVGRAAVVTGIAFALGGSRRAHGSATRSSLAGVVVGVAGLIAALTFAASLDRLVSTPSRYGWTGDFAIVDVNDDMVAEAVADERLEAVSVVSSKAFDVDGVSLQGFSFRDLRDTTGWTVLDGRQPAASGEIMLSARTADRLGRDVGDVVEVRRPDGSRLDLGVVGLGVGPALGGERSDEMVLVHDADMAGLGRAESFVEAYLRVGPGYDVETVIADYAPKYELALRELPSDLRNLDQLGNLPLALGAFLSLVALVALVHALVVTSSRRGHDLAVLAAIGFTRRQVAGSVTTMALAVAGIGLVLGVPLGAAAGRLVWWGVADAVGVATDARQPLLAVAVAVPVVLTVAVLASWFPARKAARRDTARALRAE